MAATSIEALCVRAQQAISRRDWEEARRYYEGALALNAGLPDVHYGLATVCFQLRELADSAHHFREAARLDPQRAGAFINLGAVLNLLNDLDAAVAALRRGIQLDSKRVEGFYNLGLVHRRKGQTDLAVQAYREALRLNPRMADAHLNLANLYCEKGQYRQAVAHYEKAVQLRFDWDRALEGLEQARAALAAEQQCHQPPPTPVPAAPSSGHVPRASLQHTVDPQRHHTFLTQLHQATVDSEKLGTSFQEALERVVEPAIKDLSSCLLHPEGSATELAECIQRFEAALRQLRSVEQSLQTTVGRVRHCGEHLPIS